MLRNSMLIALCAIAELHCLSTSHLLLVLGATGCHRFLALPQLRFFDLDFSELFTKEHLNPAAWSAVLAYTLVMVFDIGGAMFGLGNLAGLVTDGSVPGAVVTYLAAALGTALGAVTGTTPLIIAAESAVGIKEGGRTGLVAVTVATCFASSMFLAPILQAIPQVATAPVLVLVGAMMMGESTHIDWSTMVTAVPAFLTIVIQPFTFSIANGIYAGLVMSMLLFFLTGSFLKYLGSFGGESKQEKQNVQADLETPLVSGQNSQMQWVNGQNDCYQRAGQQTAAAAMLESQQFMSQQHQIEQQQQPPYGHCVVDGIPIDARRSSYMMPIGSAAASVPLIGSGPGSYRSHSHSHPYERGSFSMYINTFGSHTASPGAALLSHTSHHLSEEPEH
eukprot:GHRR01021987.1.p1 GENE.GHRR01021987.1~~GHRR01021987.1.p1  ORF type:complete len:391 (+),score=87.50 GHRR01021987.1:88-1260(+)